MFCPHKWKKKRDELYTKPKKYIADILECTICGEVRIENITKYPWSIVLQPTIGVFAGIFDTKGILASQYSSFVGSLCLNL